MSCRLRVFELCRLSELLEWRTPGLRGRNRGVKFTQPWNNAVHNCKNTNVWKSARCTNVSSNTSSRVHKVCAWNGAHLQGSKVHNYLSSFLWFSLDHAIWKISRHYHFHRVCAAHLAHPEYPLLFRGVFLVPE